MDPLAQSLNRIASSTARESRAIFRGNVETIEEDGSANVRLPNGGLINLQPSILVQFSLQQPVAMLRAGNGFEILTQSAYYGGLGAPIDP